MVLYLESFLSMLVYRRYIACYMLSDIQESIFPNCGM